MASPDWNFSPSDRPLPASGDFQRDRRARMELERQEAEERRQRQLSEQASLLNDPPARVRAWEKAHGLTLPRAAGHPVLAVVAEATQLTLEQIHDEQRRRAVASRPVSVRESPPDSEPAPDGAPGA